VALVGIDSNVLADLRRALRGDYDPDADDREDLRDDCVAVFRLRIYTGDLCVPPTASIETEETPAGTRRDDLLRIQHAQIDDLVLPSEAEPALDARALHLVGFHPAGPKGLRDCRILAEVELAEHARALLTRDRALLEAVAPRARVLVLKPSDWWRRLNLPPGTPPLFEPQFPRKRDWWRW